MIIEKNTIRGASTRVRVMPPERSVGIDTERDLYITEK